MKGDKTLETKFFKTMGALGTVGDCFRWMEKQYDLMPYINAGDEERAERNRGKAQAQAPNWVAGQRRLMERILEECSEFDFEMLRDEGYAIDASPLMAEIASNIDGLGDDRKHVERYIYSLLQPFKYYSDIITPIMPIKTFKGRIRQHEQELQMWEQRKKEAADKSGIDEALEHIKSCTQEIESCERRIERAGYVRDKYREMLQAPYGGYDTVEDCLRGFHNLICEFGYMLDALLLERGINLLWYQRNKGIYLFEKRNVQVLSWLFGDERTRRYIDEALPKMETEPGEAAAERKE
ncbi:MAG: hypothetical protein LUB83_00120 [Prevotellaceae bacterium]|nr:hypothetical protein [Prevotellaceae bacterium]